MERSPEVSVVGGPGDERTAREADLTAIRNARESPSRNCVDNSPTEMEEAADGMIREHSISHQVMEASPGGFALLGKRDVFVEFGDGDLDADFRHAEGVVFGKR